MRTVLVPFDGLMEAIEQYLIDEKFIKDDEQVIYVDLGLETDQDGNVEVDVELQKLIEDKSEGKEYNE